MLTGLQAVKQRQAYNLSTIDCRILLPRDIDGLQFVGY